MGPLKKTPKTVVNADEIMAMENGQMMNLVKMSYGCASMEELLNLVSSFLSEIKPPDTGTNEQLNSDEKDKVNKKCRIKERLMFFHSIYKEISEISDSNRNVLNQLRDPERQNLLTNPHAMEAIQQIQQGLDQLHSVAPALASRMNLGCGMSGIYTVSTIDNKKSSVTTTDQQSLCLSQSANIPKNNVAYLSLMSHLLALYIDLEVATCLESSKPKRKKKSEKRENEEEEKGMKELLSRIVTSLYTILDQSEDHILDTVLKLRPPFNEDPNNEIFHSIYASIYRCVVKRAAKHQVKDLTYVRYVLIYKLWDMIAKNDERENVIKQAATHLCPPPGFLKRRRTLPRILPKPSKETKNLTEFYLRERYNPWKRVKKLLEATSQAIHHSTMFPNFSSKPRLLISKNQETSLEPSLNDDGPVEEITTPQSISDDLWTRLCCEEPLSETSLIDQVTFFKKPHKLTVTKMYKTLNRHYLRDKARAQPIKKSVERAKPTGPGRGDDLKILKTSKLKVGVLPETPSVKLKKPANNIKNNIKKKAVELPEPPVLKKVKIEMWEPSENHIPVHASYETYKKDPPVISAAVSPFIANITKPTCSSMPPPAAASPAVKEKKLLMVNASVSPVESLDWTSMNSCLDLKHDQVLQQSCPTPPKPSAKQKKQLMVDASVSPMEDLGITFLKPGHNLKQRQMLQESCSTTPENPLTLVALTAEKEKKPLMVDASVGPMENLDWKFLKPCLDLKQDPCLQQICPEQPPTAEKRKKPLMVDASIGPMENMDWTFLKPCLDLKQDPSLQQVFPEQPPAAEKEKKTLMVDVSVSPVEDLDWRFLKPFPDLKQDQSPQSCSSSVVKQMVPSSETITQSIFEKPANYLSMEDLLKSPMSGVGSQTQKKDQMNIGVDGSIGLLSDTQFSQELSGFDLDDPQMWPEPVDSLTDRILNKWFSDYSRPEDLPTTILRNSSESQDWSHNFSTS